MATLIALATEMSRAFETAERTNGEKFKRLKDDSPQWMTDIVHAAHGDMLPDDWRYSMVEDAVDAIANLADDADEDAIIEARDTIEADIYTHALTGWLHSRNDRYAYCDDAMEDYGHIKADLCAILSMGQQREKQEVFDQVLEALRELADDGEER